MARGTGMIVMRSIVAVLIALLGVYTLSHGRVVIGVLLLALAAMNVMITLSIHRRRKMVQERFPGLAERRRQGGFAGRANMGPWGSEATGEPGSEPSSAPAGEPSGGQIRPF